MCPPSKEEISPYEGILNHHVPLDSHQKKNILFHHSICSNICSNLAYLILTPWSILFSHQYFLVASNTSLGKTSYPTRPLPYGATSDNCAECSPSKNSWSRCPVKKTCGDFLVVDFLGASGLTTYFSIGSMGDRHEWLMFFSNPNVG